MSRPFDQKQSLFKRVLSYFYPIKIEVVESEYSGQLEVTLQNGKLVLNSPNANYSFDSLHRVFQSVISDVIKIREDAPKEVLILGFGVGSIAHILKREKGINCHITGVEIDPAVIRLGEAYFGLDDYSNLKLLNTDALSFMSQTDIKADLIFVDLFINTEVDSNILKSDFYHQLSKALNRGKLAVINTMVQRSELEALLDKLDAELGQELDISHRNYYGENEVIFLVKK